MGKNKLLELYNRCDRILDKPYFNTEKHVPLSAENINTVDDALHSTFTAFNIRIFDKHAPDTQGSQMAEA